MSDVESKFTCKCGKMENWITEGRKTEPCPKCGRVYIGYYDKKNLTIQAIDIDEINESNTKRGLLTKIGLNYELKVSGRGTITANTQDIIKSKKFKEQCKRAKELLWKMKHQ